MKPGWLKNVHRLGPTYTDLQALHTAPIMTTRGERNHEELRNALANLAVGDSIDWRTGTYLSIQNAVYNFRRRNRVRLKTEAIEGGLRITRLKRD